MNKNVKEPLEMTVRREYKHVQTSRFSIRPCPPPVVAEISEGVTKHGKFKLCHVS